MGERGKVYKISTYNYPYLLDELKKLNRKFSRSGLPIAAATNHGPCPNNAKNYQVSLSLKADQNSHPVQLGQEAILRELATSCLDEQIRISSSGLDPLSYLASVSSSIRRGDGKFYDSSSENPTHLAATNRLISKDHGEITAKDYSYAKKAISWLLAKKESDAHLEQLRTLFQKDVIKSSDLPLAASLLLAYKNKKGSELSVSEYLGSLGERIETTVTYLGRIVHESTEYGISYTYRFHHDQKDRLIWKTSVASPLDGTPLVEGDQYHIRATVKEHSRHKGINYTLLSRVSFIVDQQRRASSE